MASIHGNEAAGTPLLRRLAAELARRPQLALGARIILIPEANPDGLARGARHNARGIDLNRNFPAGNFSARARHGGAPLSEPESRAIMSMLEEYPPDCIVSIHQPVACIDYDGPAEELARAMAAHTDLPVRRIGSRPGSLGSYAGLTLGIPIITLELPRSADGLHDEALWNRYGPCLLAALRFAADG